MKEQIEHLIITGRGFISSSLREYFETKAKSSIRVWIAGRSTSKNSITSIVEQNQLENFGVILSGWSGVIASMATDSKVQNQSLWDFEKQLVEVEHLRPIITLGFGSQIENAPIEHSGLSNLTEYAAAKIAARKRFEALIENSGLAGKWIRIFSVYGPKMHDSWLLPQLIRAGMNGTPLRMGTCEHKWGLLHVSDFSAAIEAILKSPSSFPNSVDLGGEANQSLRNLVHEVENILERKCAIFADNGLAHPDSIPDLIALKNSGWQARVTLRQGLLELKDSYAQKP